LLVIDVYIVIKTTLILCRSLIGVKLFFTPTFYADSYKPWFLKTFVTYSLFCNKSDILLTVTNTLGPCFIKFLTLFTTKQATDIKLKHQG